MCYVHNQWYDISCATLYDSLPINPCDITSQSTVLVCTGLVLNKQHCPSQSTSRFYADDFAL